MNSKRTFSPDFKAKVALESLEQSGQVSAIAAKYQITEGQVYKRRSILKEKAFLLFGEKKQVVRGDFIRISDVM